MIYGRVSRIEYVVSGLLRNLLRRFCIFASQIKTSAPRDFLVRSLMEESNGSRSRSYFTFCSRAAQSPFMRENCIRRKWKSINNRLIFSCWKSCSSFPFFSGFNREILAQNFMHSSNQFLAVFKQKKKCQKSSKILIPVIFVQNFFLAETCCFSNFQIFRHYLWQSSDKQTI